MRDENINPMQKRCFFHNSTCYRVNSIMHQLVFQMCSQIGFTAQRGVKFYNYFIIIPNLFYLRKIKHFEGFTRTKHSSINHSKLRLIPACLFSSSTNTVQQASFTSPSDSSVANLPHLALINSSYAIPKKRPQSTKHELNFVLLQM